MTHPTPAAPANRDLLNAACVAARRVVLVCGPEWAIPAMTDLARAHVEAERNVRWPNVSSNTARMDEIGLQAREARDAAAELSDRFVRQYQADRPALVGYLDTMIALTAAPAERAEAA